jgi:hypothetical protein
LIDRELDAGEARFGLALADGYRAFLAAALPVGQEAARLATGVRDAIPVRRLSVRGCRGALSTAPSG